MGKKKRPSAGAETAETRRDHHVGQSQLKREQAKREREEARLTGEEGPKCDSCGRRSGCNCHPLAWWEIWTPDELARRLDEVLAHLMPVRA